MALASFTSVEIPGNPGMQAGAATLGFTAVTLDAVSEYCGMVVPAPKAGTIKKVLFNVGTVTTGATLDVTIEGVSATTGGPDGTPLTNGTTTAAVAAGDANTQVTATFATGPTVTKGQLIAVKVANPSSSAGNLQINAHSGTVTSTYFPYSFTGLPTLTKSRNVPCIALEYSDGSYAYIPRVMQVSAFTSETLASGGTPDEVGLKFKFPVPVKVDGAWWQGSQIASASVEITLYDSDGTTALETVTVDTEQVQTTSTGYKRIGFTQEHSLSKDTFYRLTIFNTDGTGLTVGGFQVGSAAAMDGAEGGQNFHRTERTDDGVWTDTTTKRPWMGLSVSAFDDGTAVGGGGGTTIAGTTMLRGMVA